MTAAEARASQASQVEEWRRTGDYTIESNEGYLISCVKVAGSGWWYCASTPPVKVEEIDGRDYFQGNEYKAHYQQGERVPPAYNYRTKTARRTLGYFNAGDHDNLDQALAAAKAVCVHHRDTTNLAGPPHHETTRTHGTAKFGQWEG